MEKKPLRLLPPEVAPTEPGAMTPLPADLPQSPTNYVPVNDHLVEKVAMGKTEVKVAIDRIPHTVDPMAKGKVENLIRFILQHQAWVTARLVDLLFRGLSKGDAQAVTQTIAAHLMASKQSVTMIGQVLSGEGPAIELATAADLAKVPPPGPPS